MQLETIHYSPFQHLEELSYTDKTYIQSFLALGVQEFYTFDDYVEGMRLAVLTLEADPFSKWYFSLEESIRDTTLLNLLDYAYMIYGKVTQDEKR